MVIWFVLLARAQPRDTFFLLKSHQWSLLQWISQDYRANANEEYDVKDRFNISVFTKVKIGRLYNFHPLQLVMAIKAKVSRLL